MKKMKVLKKIIICFVSVILLTTSYSCRETEVLDPPSIAIDSMGIIYNGTP